MSTTGSSPQHRGTSRQRVWRTGLGPWGEAENDKDYQEAAKVVVDKVQMAAVRTMSNKPIKEFKVP